MSKKALVFLAEGFEEMEAVICIDILRRGGIDVITAAVGDNDIVTGSRRIPVKADILLKDLHLIPDALVFPGGLTGAENLAASGLVKNLAIQCANEKKIIAAICASPAYSLVKFGLLTGRKATCYPDFIGRFGNDVTYVKEDVVLDGNIITSAGVGTAFSFALTIVKELAGEKTANEVQNKALIK